MSLLDAWGENRSESWECKTPFKCLSHSRVKGEF